MVDEIVINKDPGPLTSATGDAWNYNRMLCSTYNGLLRAKRKYSLKMRADLEVSGVDFLGVTCTMICQVWAHIKYFEGLWL